MVVSIATAVAMLMDKCLKYSAQKGLSERCFLRKAAAPVPYTRFPSAAAAAKRDNTLAFRDASI